VTQIFPPPSPRRVYPNDEYIHLLVPMERDNLSRTPVYPTASQGRRRLGSDPPKSQMSNTSLTSHVAAEPKLGDNHSGLFEQVEHN
jgi:hypothetical protein